MPIKKQTNKLIKMKEKQKQPPSAYFIIKRTDEVVNYLIF